MRIYEPFWPSGPQYSDRVIQPQRGPLAPFGFPGDRS
jgi:hypothetical protein